jgi:hypothetical protein
MVRLVVVVVGFGVRAVTVMVVGAGVMERVLVTVVGFEVGLVTVMAVEPGRLWERWWS